MCSRSDCVYVCVCVWATLSDTYVSCVQQADIGDGPMVYRRSVPATVSHSCTCIYTYTTHNTHSAHSTHTDMLGVLDDA